MQEGMGLIVSQEESEVRSEKQIAFDETLKTNGYEIAESVGTRKGPFHLDDLTFVLDDLQTEVDQRRIRKFAIIPYIGTVGSDLLRDEIYNVYIVRNQ